MSAGLQVAGLPRTQRTLFVKTSASTTTTLISTPEVLHTYTIPANMFAADGDTIRVQYYGDMTAGVECSAGFMFEGRLVLFMSGFEDVAGGSFHVFIELMRVSSGKLCWHYEVTLNGYTAPPTHQTITVNEPFPGFSDDPQVPVDFTAAITLSMLGLADAAPGLTLVQGGARAEFIPAP